MPKRNVYVSSRYFQRKCVCVCVVCVCVCVCVCARVCTHVYEDTDLYNDMGIYKEKVYISEHFQCPHN